MAKIIYKVGCEGQNELSCIEGIEIELLNSQKALIMLRKVAGMLGGEASIDQMMENVVDLFRVKDKEERQRMKELISGYTVVPIEKGETPSMKIKSQDIKS